MKSQTTNTYWSAFKEGFVEGAKSPLTYLIGVPSGVIFALLWRLA